MGDNALSILIQAKIDEASSKTIESQLKTLQKNLSSIKISLDLGDIKSQFSSMFGEIEKEARKRNLGGSIGRPDPQNASFTGSQDEAMRKATAHAEGLRVNMQSVRDIVKDMGNLTGLTETFRSADGNLVKMKATVEDVNGTLKQVRTVDVFAVLDENGKIAEYQMGKMVVKTKEFGMTLEELQSAGKGNPYKNLYDSMVQFIEGGQNATKVANDLHNAIYTKKGEERDFFKKLNPNVQQEYLTALAKARTEEMKMDEVHRQALIMNEQMKVKQMDALHKEALAMNKAYDKQKQAQAKEREAIDKAHYQALQEEAKRNQKAMDKIHAEALAENKRRDKEKEALDKAHREALKMNQQMDIKQQTQQANVDFFKSQMNGKLNGLLATSNVDPSAVQALKTAMEQLDGKTKNVGQRMKELRAQFQSLKDGSVTVTTATANMGLLETEIHNVTAQFKLGEIGLEQYIQKLSSLMRNEKGQYSDAFNGSIDIQNRIKYIAQLEQAEAKHASQVQQQRQLYKQVAEQLQALEKNKFSMGIDGATFANLKGNLQVLELGLKNGSISIDMAKQKFKEIQEEMKKYNVTANQTGANNRKLFDTFKMMIGIYSLYDVFNLCKRAIKSMAQEVKTLDSALVEMNKVAMLSSSELEKFTSTAFNISSIVGRVGSDVVNATGDFVKMGESIENATELAKNALMYMNVGDLSSTKDATGAMISTMKAFGIEAQNSLQIVDKINNVANNFAIDARGIGAGLQRASSALASANNDINETLAMMAVGNQVVQDPESLANGLKTISMRIRGLSEDGEELESNMEELFNRYANGIKVLNDDGSFRSTFEILNDLGKVWDNLTDKQQAFLAEKVAGKHRSNIFLAIMENAQDLEKALETSQNSANSAIIENERYMDSIAGKTAQMQSAWQSLSASIVDSGVVKGILDAITSFIKFVETSELVQVALAGLATAFTALTVIKVSSWVMGIIPTLLKLHTTLKTMFAMIVAGEASVLQGLSLLMINPVVATVTVLTGAVMGLVMAMNHAKKKAEEIKQVQEQLNQQTQEEARQIQDLTQNYKDLHDPITGVVTDKERLLELQRELSLAYGSEANGIDLVNGKYEEQIEKLNELTLAKLQSSEGLQKDALMTAQENAKNAMKGDSDKGLFVIDYQGQKEEIDKVIEYMKVKFGNKFLTEEIGGEISFKMNTEDIQEAEQMWAEMLATMQNEGVERTNDTYERVVETLTNVKDASNQLNIAQDALHKTQSAIILKNAEQEIGFKDLKTVTEAQAQAIVEFVNEATKSDPVLKQYMNNLLSVANINLSDTLGETSKALREYNHALEEVDSKISLAKQAFNDLDGAIKSATDGKIMDADTIIDLIEKYPQLRDELVKTDKGYALSKEALMNLRQARVDEANQALETQKANTTNVIEGVRNRMKAYAQEITSIKTLADAQKALAGAKAKSANIQKEIKEIDDKRAQRFEDFKNGKPLYLSHSFVDQFAENAKYNTLKQQLEDAKKYEAGLNEMVEGYKTIEELEKKALALQVTATNGYVSATTPSKGSSGSKNGSSSPKASYVKSLFQEMADDILEGGEKIEKAIAVTEAKLEKARLIGDTALAGKLEKELVTLQEGLRNKQSMMRKELDIQIKAMAQTLSATGQFKNYNLSSLTSLDVAEVIQKLDKQINSATLAENEKEVDRLNNLKSIISDVGTTYIKVREEARELSAKYLEEDNEWYERKINAIDAVYDREYEKIDRSNKLLELQAVLMNETSEDYAKNQQGMLDNLIKAQELAVRMMQDVKKAGMGEDSEAYKKYYDKWYDAELAIRNMKKKMADDARKQRQDELSKLDSDLKEAQDNVKKVLDSTMKMIEQEYKNRKKMLQDELDAYEKIIDKKKEKLKADKQEADNSKAINEKTKKVTDLEAKLSAIQFDTSAKGKAEKLKLEEELAKARQELEEEQADQAYDAQVEALDKEFEAFKETQDKKIKEIEDYLEKEGNIRAEAIKRIENQSQETYQKLLEWNRQYGSGVDEDITMAWNGAQEAMEQFNDGQVDVLSVLNKIAVKMKEVSEEAEKLKDSTQNDYSDIWAGTQDSPDSNINKPTGDSYEKVFESTVAQMNKNSKAWGGASAEEKQRLANENKQLAKKIGAWQANSDGAGWNKGDWVVQQNGKVVAIKNLSSYHTGGIVGGVDEAGLKTTEQFAKLLKGEVVVTENQMAQFMNRTLPSMAGISPASTGEIKIEKMFDIVVEGNLDEKAVPRIEELAKQLVPRIANQLNQAVFGRGIKKPI